MHILEDLKLKLQNVEMYNDMQIKPEVLDFDQIFESETPFLEHELAKN